MNAIPAKIAKKYCYDMPPINGKLNPLVLAAADLCGVDKIFNGGAYAVAALVLAPDYKAVKKVDLEHLCCDCQKESFWQSWH